MYRPVNASSKYKGSLTGLIPAINKNNLSVLLEGGIN